MRRALSIVVGLALFGVALARATGGGDDSDDGPKWCRLERIDTAPLSDDRLRLYTSVLRLDGSVIEGMRPVEFTLHVDKRPAGKAEKVQVFSAMHEEVDVALVVEVAAQYKKAIDNVKEALTDFLHDQPTSMKVTLVTYGSEISKPSKLLGAPMMAEEIDKLSVDDDSADVRMTDAIRIALGELKKLDPIDPAKLPPRRVIVVISDGLNAKMDRETFKRLGKEARRVGVAIHTIAYSPIDERGPLLALGDLSKRSGGTFRWAKKSDNLKEQLDNLAVEMRSQYVLTFKTAISSTEKHSFSVQCRQIMSDRIGGLKDDARLAWYWWVLIVVGVLVALFVLLMILAGIRERQTTPSLGGDAAPARPGKVPVAAKAPRGAGARVVGRAVAPQPQGRARAATLIAVTGPVAGQRFPVAGRITIGKGAGHTITITGDAALSTNHCEIVADGGGFTLRDLGSTNGTFVNGRKIGAPQRLNDGDLIRCGTETQFKLRFD